MAGEAPPRTRYCSNCLTSFPTDPDRCTNLSCGMRRPKVGWGELLETGEVIDRTYRIHRRLAIGGAGATYLGREVDNAGEEIGPLLAVKLLYQQRDQGGYLRRLATEAQILQSLNHPQIVECRGFVHRSGHSPYLVTKFEAGGSLLDHLRREGLLSPGVTARIGRQICAALEIAHRQGVIHRDLKPENVLLEAEVPAAEVPSIRVADFGIAKVFGGVGERLTRVGAFVGTPQYAAPEQFEGVAPEPATDVYAVGAVLLFCMTARPVTDFLPELDPEQQRENLVLHLPPKIPELDGEVRRWFEDTLAMAMAPDMGDRCSIATLDERLGAIADMRDPGPVSIGHGPAITPSRQTITLPPGSLQPITTGGEAREPVELPAADTEKVARPEPPPGETEKLVRPEPPPGETEKLVRPEPPPGETEKLVRPEPPPPRVVAERSGGFRILGCGVATLAALALLGAVLGGAGWYVYNRDDSVLLTGKEDDPARVKDWQLVASKLGEVGVTAERTCSSPPYLALEAVVEGDGKLRALRLLNYPHEPTRACIEKALAGTVFPRAGTDTVRVGVTLRN